MSKYGVFSSPFFPVFGLNTGKYRPEKTPHLCTFYVVVIFGIYKGHSLDDFINKHVGVEQRYYHYETQSITKLHAAKY